MINIQAKVSVNSKGGFIVSLVSAASEIGLTETLSDVFHVIHDESFTLNLGFSASKTYHTFRFST